MVVCASAHAQLAACSGLYLLYGVGERTGEAAHTIVAALTAGDASDFMAPRRHGVFIDRQGRDWQFTLRQRNIGLLLDANGWTVNARARVGIAFGARLTEVARRPAGSRRVNAAA